MLVGRFNEAHIERVELNVRFLNAEGSVGTGWELDRMGLDELGTN